MARVLVIDDQPQIRDVLGSYLTAASHQVIEAGTAQQGLDLLATADPDVVLLDLGLPDRDGIDVLREIRSRSSVFVLVVTARSEEVDRLIGLSVGADDYIVKPFSPREVVARVGVVLRRGQASEPSQRRSFPGLGIDADRREVVVDTTLVELTALEFDLLWALSENPGRVFSRRQLLERVWGDDYFGDERLVDVHIRGLRKALGDDAQAPRFVGTLRGVGYRFLLDAT